MEGWDVIVVGGGNAAMSAAVSARHHARRVLVLERAPRWLRGGNTRHVRNLRFAHDQADAFNTGSYSEEELFDDLVKVAGPPRNEKLARLVVRESKTLPAWMGEHGVRFQPPLRGTLQLGRTNRFFLGGGKALVNTWYATAQKMGIAVRYEASVEDLVIEDTLVKGVVVDDKGQRQTIPAAAVVVACGGFEANLEWLKQYWGDAADNYIVRGTPCNDGRVLAALLERGAATVGDPKGFHAIAVDARAPKYDGGIATRLDTVPFGIVVNRKAQRFADEGQDIWPKRYASWGRLIAEQPGQIAYSIFDAKTVELSIPPMFEPFVSETIEGVGAALGLDVPTLVDTVRTYNAHLNNDRRFDTATLDGLATHDLQPPKSNWAVPIDTPPFYGLPLRPGITFTYMGVGVDERCRVLHQDGRPFRGLYAAGEIMSGNVLWAGYLAGFGVTIGAATGRLAGREAATHAAG